jgi:ParB-like chromosome segregation protein Spo0J
MDKAGLDDLTASVKEHGVLQPILVRPLAERPTTS